MINNKNRQKHNNEMIKIFLDQRELKTRFVALAQFMGQDIIWAAITMHKRTKESKDVLPFNFWTMLSCIPSHCFYTGYNNGMFGRFGSLLLYRN